MAVAALFVQRLKRADNTITLAIEFHHVLYAILIQLPSEVLAHIDGSACVCIHHFTRHRNIQELKIMGISLYY